MNGKRRRYDGIGVRRKKHQDETSCGYGSRVINADDEEKEL